MSLNIIGISAFGHDSACCLIHDGIFRSAVKEEHFTRKKNDANIPSNAFLHCIESGNLSINDIDIIAYYEKPDLKLARQLWSGFDIEDKNLKAKLDPKRPEREIRELLGYKGTIEYIDHHLAHAASSYFYSGFKEASIMNNDGVGEWATTTYGYGNGKDIKILGQVEFPNSIGLFYSTITSYLGFKVNSGEYEVMGLAPYGKPVYVKKIRKLIKNIDKGNYELELKYFDFVRGQRMYSDELVELLGRSARLPESHISQFHKDIARSLQYVLEEILLENTKYLYEITKSPNLCLGGGVALNCVANRRILKEGLFKNIFVQPSAGNSGAALGAAAVSYVRHAGNRLKTNKLKHVYLGAEYSDEEIKKFLDSTSLKYEDYSKNRGVFMKKVAKLIAEGNVVGWFQGKMEFSPRGLGNRSILADPRCSDMRDRINSIIKKKEVFRPFASAVLEEKMQEHFSLDSFSPFMQRTCDVISKLNLPAIKHVDNSACVQTVNIRTNPCFAELIMEFEKLTGCPIVLNTSFNVIGKPIVKSPKDAICCFITTDIDCLAIGSFIIQRANNSLEFLRSVLSELL